MGRGWCRQDRAVVEAALRRGERPDPATPLGAGVLDELVALHEELGILEAVGELAVTRERAGLADGPLLRTLATLPFLPEGSLSGATAVLFREPALLLRLGWSPVEIRAGANGRRRHPAGRRAESLPCHPDTLRDMLRRVPAEAWAALQRRGVRALYARGLVRGSVYAIDGSALGPDLRLVSLVCVSAARPLVVAWRLLEGAASEKGREASVTRALVEQALAAGGAGCIRLLLADALYADGPLLAWLKYAHGIDALVRLPADRRLYAEARVAVGLDGQGWTRRRYTRTIRGHKALRTVESAAAGELRLRESFADAATEHGASDPTLWVGFLRDVTPSPADAPPADAPTDPRAPARAGQHPRLADRLRRLPGVSSPLAHRERPVPRAQGGLGPRAPTLGARSRRRVGPTHPDLPRLQHRPGLPHPPGHRPRRARHPTPPPVHAPRPRPGPGRHLPPRLLRRLLPRGTVSPPRTPAARLPPPSADHDVTPMSLSPNVCPDRGPVC